MPIAWTVPMRNYVFLSGGQSSGICMAISAFWLQRCRQLGGNAPGGGDRIFTNWRDYETMAVTFETMLGDYNLVTGGDAQATTQGRLQQQSLIWHDLFSDQLGLPTGEVNWGTVDTLDFLISLMDAGPSRGYLMTGYRTHVGGGPFLLGGHTVAFWYGPAYGNKTFMDPNFGQWTVPRAYAWAGQITTHLTFHYNNFNQWLIMEVG